MANETSFSELCDLLRADCSARRQFDVAEQARWEAAKATSREAAIAYHEAEIDVAIDRIQRELEIKQPEFFDANGQLRIESVNKKTLELTGGKRYLNRDESFTFMRVIQRVAPASACSIRASTPGMTDFRVDRLSGAILGRTEIGRATAAQLRLDDARTQRTRYLWILLYGYPGDPPEIEPEAGT